MSDSMNTFLYNNAILIRVAGSMCSWSKRRWETRQLPALHLHATVPSRNLTPKHQQCKFVLLRQKFSLLWFTHLYQAPLSCRSHMPQCSISPRVWWHGCAILLNLNRCLENLPYIFENHERLSSGLIISTLVISFSFIFRAAVCCLTQR